MSFYVYILLCVDGSFYTGYTKNVEIRSRQHENGKGARYTKTHKPKQVAYVEHFTTRSQAMKREKAIKKLSHKEKQDLVSSQNKKKA